MLSHFALIDASIHIPPRPHDTDPRSHLLRFTLSSSHAAQSPNHHHPPKYPCHPNESPSQRQSRPNPNSTSPNHRHQRTLPNHHHHPTITTQSSPPNQPHRIITYPPPHCQMLRNEDDYQAVGVSEADLADDSLPWSPQPLFGLKRKLMSHGQWTEKHKVRGVLRLWKDGNILHFWYLILSFKSTPLLT